MKLGQGIGPDLKRVITIVSYNTFLMLAAQRAGRTQAQENGSPADRRFDPQADRENRFRNGLGATRGTAASPSSNTTSSEATLPSIPKTEIKNDSRCPSKKGPSRFGIPAVLAATLSLD
jgi:hypothetical protein